MSRPPAKPAAGRESWEAIFDTNFVEDLLFFVGANPHLATRILELVQAVLGDSFGGVGKPEPLRGQVGGAWSRRINQEHRLVYKVADRRIYFVQARYHYEK